MIDTVKNAVVLGGSGTIGSLAGGLMAQNGIKVYLLSRNTKRAKAGLAKAVAQARSEVIAKNIVCGDYDNLLVPALQEADLVLESVTEDLALKRRMYGEVDKSRRPDAIIGTTTSSLPLTEMSQGMSESFRRHFLSTHFYNPPGKMLACEVAAQPDTDPEVYDFMKHFLQHELRRVVIPVKNVAGFAGNRIAFLLFNQIATLAQEHGVEMMDYLIGPYTGRLLSPLATLDLVGLDIYRAIIESLRRNTDDEMHSLLVLPEYVDIMIDNGSVGNKAKRGFYKKVESGKSVFLDPATCDYVPGIKPHVGFVEAAKQLIRIGKYREAFESVKAARTKEADVVMDILCTYIAYSYARIGEVTERELGMEGIDAVMSYGFNWASPSVMVQMLGGGKTVAALLRERGLNVPTAISDQKDTTCKTMRSGKYFVAR